MYNTVYLKKGKEESLGRFHPWVFSGAIHHIDGRPEEGDVVRILSADGRFLAVGHVQIGSIAVRVLSFEDITIDRNFWYQRLSAAYDVRKSIFPQWADGNKDGKLTNAFCLVHGEGDGLPGLVIDVYDRTAVMQAHSVGMHVSRHEIADALAEVLDGVVENIYYKSENTLAYKASEDGGNGFLKGGLARIQSCNQLLVVICTDDFHPMRSHHQRSRQTDISKSNYVNHFHFLFMSR